MNRVVLAGAAAIENVERLSALLQNKGLEFTLLENSTMYSSIPSHHQEYVVQSESFNYTGETFIPLNEYWISIAKDCGVNNLTDEAINASRSKLFLSTVLKLRNIPCVNRYCIDDPKATFPERYIARPDTGYSGYGVFSYKDMGPFDRNRVIQAVTSEVKPSMTTVMATPEIRVVVEEYLEGDEFSADIFIQKGDIKILRIFYKSINWINGKPVCDSYVSIPQTAQIKQAIHSWCKAIFSKNCISFAQFDFIANNNQLIPVDFSCRIGGGINTIKQFSGIDSYVFSAMFHDDKLFNDFVCQKHILVSGAGYIKSIRYELPENFTVYEHRQKGDSLHNNISSANARVADVCFYAESMADALEKSKTVNRMVTINVENQ